MLILKKGLIFLIILFGMGFSATSNAGLTVIGTAAYNGNNYNIIYEDDQHLIWLDYTYRMGMGWEDYFKWAAGLNASGVLTYKLNPGINVAWDGGWRLPNTVDGSRKWGYDGTTTAGFNITTSEMGHLFYKSLGNTGYYDAKGKQRSGWGADAAWGLKNKGPFANIYPEYYWSNTEYAIYTELAWAFGFNSGSQTSNTFKHMGTRYIGLAVRPGKIVTTPVSAK
jgi:hypothetical protein